MQLFWHQIPCNLSMLGPIFYFWNKTTNTLQHPYGIISPTLFELATIVGLWPTRQVIHFDLVPDYVKAYNFNNFELAYSAFIWNNMGSPSTPVSDDKHVAFLSY